jgi:hypothetical protein
MTNKLQINKAQNSPQGPFGKNGMETVRPASGFWKFVFAICLFFVF